LLRRLERPELSDLFIANLPVCQSWVYTLANIMSWVAVIFVFIDTVRCTGLTFAEITVIETVVFTENAAWHLGRIVSRRLNIFSTYQWVALFIDQAEVRAPGL
jgi:hypothetical protein